jgi:ubiquinone/menaquinone biosynthesis C-methylase UbiE
MAPPETDDERAVRERKRFAFDQAAERYDATRSGYPAQVVSFMVRTAGAAAGSRALEIGCGTGQLTQPAGHGAGDEALTARGSTPIEGERRGASRRTDCTRASSA